MRSIILVLVLTAALTGCGAIDTMTEGFKHSEEVAVDLEQSVGSKPFVGFNWSNGLLVDVSISFDGIPSGKSIEQIAQMSKQSVSARFKQSPKHVVISFVMPGE
jgi:hypothetical protein